MLKNILLVLLTFIAVPAYAADLHPAVQMHIDEARTSCEKAKGKFTFDEKSGLQSADLNDDGRDDYIVSSAGFTCEGAASIYDGSSGHTHFIVTSQPGGDGSLYSTDESIIVAYSFTVDKEKKPAAITFETRCLGKDGTQIGKAHWAWKDGKMAVISAGEGCKD
jgi:hypothetical protein